MNILFTCAGRRNYLLEYFKTELNGKGKIIAADMDKTAPAMAVADKAIAVPPIYNSGYLDEIFKICIEENVNAIISLNDLELPILAGRKNEFEQEGIKVLISSKEIIDICFDKLKSFEFANQIGLNTPATFLNLKDFESAIDSGLMKFPVVVKPRWGSASIGIEFPETMQELKLVYELLKIKIKRSILSEVSNKDIENSILIQEKITGKEYGIDVLNDLKGKINRVFVKEKLAMRAGETDKAKLVELPEVEKIGVKIGQELKHIGNLDCDVMEMNGKFYFIEMNPRFGGGYPFTHMAGGNYPEKIISWLKGDCGKLVDYEKSYKIYSKCDTLIDVSRG